MKICGSLIRMTSDLNDLCPGWPLIWMTSEGLAIYLHEKYNLKTLLIISEIFKGKFIEISEVDTNRPTHILLGSIYRPPRDILLNYKSFTEELALTFQTFKDRNYDIILGGDMNIDLLKIKEKDFVNEYFDMIVSSGFFFTYNITHSNLKLWCNINS